MSRIETIKACVKPADAAKKYGLVVTQYGMTNCPFHNDRRPSMKLYDDHFYCFACGAHGDVINLTAQLLGVSLKESVPILEADFHIGPEDDPPAVSLREKPHLMQFQKEEHHCLAALTEYAKLLRDWKRDYAPKSPDDEIEDRYVEACMKLDYIEDLVDCLCEADLEHQIKIVNMMQDCGLIDRIVQCLEEVAEDECAA